MSSKGKKGKGEEQRGNKGDCSCICIKNNTAPPAKRVRACVPKESEGGERRGNRKKQKTQLN